MISKLSEMKVFTSCVGIKTLDEAITKAYLIPSGTWRNPCKESLSYTKKVLPLSPSKD